MNTTPGWQAPLNGLPTNQNADNASAHVNQLLGTHAVTPIYEGAQIVSPGGGAQFTWLAYGNTTDLAQPFTMPAGQTTVGRVTLPVQPTGSGADLMVSLYPDNGSGAPNTGTPLASTIVPASWITHMAAPSGLSAGGPLATARFNTIYPTGGVPLSPWGFPASDASGVASSASVTTSGNYLILAGGFGASAPITDVFTVGYVGGSTLAQPVPQPALPQATASGMVAATTSSIVLTGGDDSVGQVANTWVASWDPNTGVIGSWSAQAPLPKAIDIAAAASHGNTVYIVGGYDGTNVLSTVYYATVNNGQLSSWQLAAPLPVAVTFPVVAAIGSWLVVTGGNLSSGPAANGSTFYAAIAADGSLGGWQAGPSLPTPVYPFTPGWSVAVTDSALVIVGGQNSSGAQVNNIQILTLDSSGPADTWYESAFPLAGSSIVSAFNTGSGGQWELVSPTYTGSSYYYTALTPVPEISVPLHATGLTAGATYHVVLQQRQLSGPTNYLSFGVLDGSALPIGALQSARHSGTWSAALSGYAMPMAVYNTASGGSVLHTWEDPSASVGGATVNANLAARTSTFAYRSAGLLQGFCEATGRPNLPLNSNPTFTGGTAGWTPTNCTLTQSNAQVHGGLPFSGLITPNGTSATVFAESNLGSVRPNLSAVNAPFWYQAQGWVYSPTGYSSVSLNVNWYDAQGTYLTTSSNTTSVPAATWTFLNAYYEVPVGAAQATLVPTESGTPSSSNLLYLSNVTLTLSPECAGVLSSVAQVNYPTGAPWPPIGVTPLA